MRLGDLDALKEELRQEVSGNRVGVFFAKRVFDLIDNAPTFDVTKNQAYDQGFITAMKLYSRPQGEWIPITTRPMTEVEEKDACERLGVDHLEDYEKRVFTCSLPDDRQEILISTRWGISLDECEIDPDYGYGLENNGDWDGVLAWMPLPEPYKDGGDKND